MNTAEGNKSSEANTEVGIAVGLVDTIINSARILRTMMDESTKKEADKLNNGIKKGTPKLQSLENKKELQEAIKDFYQDADVKHLFVYGIRLSGNKINTEKSYVLTEQELNAMIFDKMKRLDFGITELRTKTIKESDTTKAT